MDENKAILEERIRLLLSELEEKKASLPAHSITPIQMIAIEELEDEIGRLKNKLNDHKKED